MKLIVGLGNPGKEYENTRHNCGFMVIDELARQNHVDVNQNKFKGLYVKTKISGEDVILLKPQTYMNNSGESVQAYMNFFKIDKEDVLIIYDDLDTNVGRIRLRLDGSAGGHNGIKSLINHLGGQNFKRLRVGIDRHKFIKIIDYVLGNFTKEEQPFIQEAVVKASEAVECFIKTDFVKAMNQYNGR